jgi:hypothetical protein
MAYVITFKNYEDLKDEQDVHLFLPGVDQRVAEAIVRAAQNWTGKEFLASEIADA